MIQVPCTLAGRAIPEIPLGDGSEVHPVPCIFCGAMIQHVNDGGIGWLLGALVDGESRTYLRCNDGLCATASSPWVWRCGCVPDYVENVGDHCQSAGRPGTRPSRMIACNAWSAVRLAGSTIAVGSVTAGA